MRILLLLILSLLSICLLARNLDKMSEKKRNAALIKIARKAVKKHAPGYYREYGEPVITRDVIDDKPDAEYGERLGRAFYVVEFPYDEEKDFFLYGYSARALIWADTGKIRMLMGGHGFGFPFRAKQTKAERDSIFIPYRKLTRHQPLTIEHDYGL